MKKMRKNRSSTPCLGICTTTFGDEVCKGCKRFSYEIVNWTKFTKEERSIVNNRLEEFKVTILKDRFKIIDQNLLETRLDENAINFNHSLNPLTWIFDLFRGDFIHFYSIHNLEETFHQYKKDTLTLLSNQ